MQPDLLKQLRDVHLPKPISWWPPAPGWYVVLAIVLLLLIISYFYLRKYQRRKRRKQTVIQQFHTLVKRNDMAAIMALIKQVALTIYPNESVAQLKGVQWLDFLQQHNPKCQLSSEERHQLATIAYQPQTVINTRLKVFLQTWLEQQL